MEITAALVKELRERSGAGMMECKKALAENGGDMDAAIEWLRKQGLAKADKKAGRIAAEGRIALAQEGSRAVLVEINSETDFVAKDANFVAFAEAVAAGRDGRRIDGLLALVEHQRLPVDRDVDPLLVVLREARQLAWLRHDGDVALAVP